MIDYKMLISFNKNMHTPVLRFVIAALLLSLIFLAGGTSATETKSFDKWLEQFRADAEKEGISKQTLDAALKGLKPLPAVVKLDRKQPETIKTFVQYHKGVVTDEKVQKGRANIKRNAEILAEITEKYNVPVRFIVALWGVETHYGKITGSFSVVNALATLAYDGRRSDFFRKELINALKIIDKKHVTVQQMKGSWAGAMGQTQFMPSSYLTYAVDYNNDGKTDIWNSPPDIFASIANYLNKSGWKVDEGWGMKVKIPEYLDQSLVDIKIQKSLKEWRQIGVKYADGKELPGNNIKFSLINLEADKKIKGGNQYYLISDNFRTLLKWNRSLYFATVVGLLSDKLMNVP